MSKVLKIALVGAQGVGKTTLAKRLRSRYPGTHIIKETVRECPYPCDQDADFKTEWWVLSHSILAEQEAAEGEAPLIVADRCLVDIAVYSKLVNENRPDRLSAGQRAMIEEVICGWLRDSPYHLVFFVKVDPEIWKKRDIDDGFRSVDPAWYATLDREFEKALERLGVDQLTQLHVIHNNHSLEEVLEPLCEELEKRHPGLGQLRATAPKHEGK